MTVTALPTARPLEGLTVVVTGEVPGLDRDQAKDAVVALGGKPSGSVSGKTSLVVAGEGAGVSKMQKVAQFGTPVLPAEEFAALAADPASWDGQPVGRPYEAPVQTPEEVEEAAEARRVRDHALTCAVVYPGGIQDIRLLCSCGHRWAGATVHDVRSTCPRDPEAVAA